MDPAVPEIYPHESTLKWSPPRPPKCSATPTEAAGLPCNLIPCQRVVFAEPASGVRLLCRAGWVICGAVEAPGFGAGYSSQEEIGGTRQWHVRRTESVLI